MNTVDALRMTIAAMEEQRSFRQHALVTELDDTLRDVAREAMHDCDRLGDAIRTLEVLLGIIGGNE